MFNFKTCSCFICKGKAKYDNLLESVCRKEEYEKINKEKTNIYYSLESEKNKSEIKKKILKCDIENKIILFHFNAKNYLTLQIQINELREMIGLYDSTYWDSYFSFKENKKKL